MFNTNTLNTAGVNDLCCPHLQLTDYCKQADFFVLVSLCEFGSYQEKNLKKPYERCKKSPAQGLCPS